MTLGKYQRYELDKLAGAMVKFDYVRVEFYAFDYRPYTREWRKGHGIYFQAFECYEEGDYKFGYQVYIANVGREDSIGEKIKELTGYLMGKGCNREKIKAKRIRGKYS